jgi:formimidoylglutamate deiminase
MQTLSLPAFATAHSHAFQRGMRGLAQRRSVPLPGHAASGKGDFWSWRAEMYRASQALTPESFERVTRVAYKELFLAGVRTVGEFHYVHHQVGGVPYAERTLLADIAIRVAKEEGLRIALLRAAYFRAGPGLPPEAEQLRFCDARVDDVIADVEALRKRYAGDAQVVIGLAPHSVRAVGPDTLRELVSYANASKIPLHMHVAEQEREVQECLAETRRRPVEWLSDIGALSERFVAVHATRLGPGEAEALGKARSIVCVCPTTERDLGDGLLDGSLLRAAGVRLCTGIDSHVITDPFEEMRALETHERLRLRERVTFAPSGITPAESLWESASLIGAIACGFADPGPNLRINTGHPTLELVPPEQMLDAVVFSGHPGILTKTMQA